MSTSRPASKAARLYVRAMGSLQPQHGFQTKKKRGLVQSSNPAPDNINLSYFRVTASVPLSRDYWQSTVTGVSDLIPTFVLMVNIFIFPEHTNRLGANNLNHGKATISIPDQPHELSLTFQKNLLLKNFPTIVGYFGSPQSMGKHSQFLSKIK